MPLMVLRLLEIWFGPLFIYEYMAFINKITLFVKHAHILGSENMSVQFVHDKGRIIQYQGGGGGGCRYGFSS